MLSLSCQALSRGLFAGGLRGCGPRTTPTCSKVCARPAGRVDHSFPDAKVEAILRSVATPTQNATMSEILVGSERRFERITFEPGKMGGRACIRGMRITVRRVWEILATYQRREEIFQEYAFLEEEDLRQALTYAAAAVDDEVLGFHRVA